MVLRESTNLPTAGEFEFTFIHRPSHNNSLGFTINTQSGQYDNTPLLPEMQAFATDVRDRLYNTRNLVLAADYHGFTAAPVNAPPSVNPAVNVPSPPDAVPGQFILPPAPGWLPNYSNPT